MKENGEEFAKLVIEALNSQKVLTVASASTQNKRRKQTTEPEFSVCEMGSKRSKISDFFVVDK